MNIDHMVGQQPKGVSHMNEMLSFPFTLLCGLKWIQIFPEMDFTFTQIQH